MELILSPYAKTVPSNYDVKGMDVVIHDVPGSTCTEEQWEKSRRMEDPHYDWNGYSNNTQPKGDHPEYVSRAKMNQLFQKWEAILQEKEPMRKHG